MLPTAAVYFTWSRCEVSMALLSTLLAWSDLSLLYSSQDHRKVLFVAWSASAFGIFEHFIFQYLSQLSHDNGVFFFAIVFFCLVGI